MLRPALLVLAGFCVAFVPVVFGWPDAPAWIAFLLMGAGSIWGAALWWRKRRRLAIALLLVLATAGHSAWYFELARYDAPQGAPVVGVVAPEFTAVRVVDGARFRLGAQRGHGVLLVFFRGPW